MLKIPVRPSLEVEAVRWDGREMFSVRSPASTGFFQRQSQSVCFEIYIQRTVVAASKVNNVASGLLCGRLLCSEPLMIAAAAKRKDSRERKAVNSPVNMTRIFSKVSQFFKVWWNHIHVANLNREQTFPTPDKNPFCPFLFSIHGPEDERSRVFGVKLAWPPPPSRPLMRT